MIPDMTFEEAFDVSGRYVNISVAPTGRAHQKSRLLNAITSPHVYIREAVRASCAVPGVHPPCCLAAKDFNGRRKPYLSDHKWIDGAITDDLPRRGLSRLYGVNHTIASQTNPAVLWALQASKRIHGPARTFFDWGTDLWRINLRTAHSLTRHISDRLGGLSPLVHIMYSVALQEYSADVTIMPSKVFYDPRTLLSENSRDETLALIASGERATWPEIERIRNNTRVSRKLSQVLEEYEGRGTKKRHQPLATVDVAGKRRRRKSD
jgi:NTE family protein